MGGIVAAFKRQREVSTDHGERQGERRSRRERYDFDYTSGHDVDVDFD
jgi:hypothetical protein